MSVNQMYAVQIAVAVLLAVHQFASVYQNMKAVHQLYHVNRQKMLAQYQLVDRIHNVRVLETESLNVHAYQVSSKVQIRFEDVLSQKIHANHSHVDTEHRVTLHVIQFVIVQNQPLEIHSSNVVHQLLLENCADQDHVAVSFNIFQMEHFPLSGKINNLIIIVFVVFLFRKFRLLCCE